MNLVPMVPEVEHGQFCCAFEQLVTRLLPVYTYLVDLLIVQYSYAIRNTRCAVRDVISFVVIIVPITEHSKK